LFEGCVDEQTFGLKSMGELSDSQGIHVIRKQLDYIFLDLEANNKQVSQNLCAICSPLIDRIADALSKTDDEPE
jgi:hypothetical protein